MQWAPRPIETVVAAIGCLVALVAALSADAAGRLLFGVAAIGLAGLVATDLALRPRLRADGDGLQIRTLGARRRLPWTEIDAVRVDERARLGLTTRALEIDADDALLVLGRRSLGADPRDVVADLGRIRFAAGPPGSRPRD